MNLDVLPIPTVLLTLLGSLGPTFSRKTDSYQNYIKSLSIYIRDKLIAILTKIVN